MLASSVLSWALKFKVDGVSIMGFPISFRCFGLSNNIACYPHIITICCNYINNIPHYAIAFVEDKIKEECQIPIKSQLF